jgi:hypothetical protein
MKYTALLSGSAALSLTAAWNCQSSSAVAGETAQEHETDKRLKRGFIPTGRHATGAEKAARHENAESEG